MNEAKAEDKTAAPAVTVAVVAYRSGATLAACVERLAQQSFSDFELVLVDNASPEREAQPVASAWPFARLIENADNLGFAAAMNQAARAGRGRWLALLNPDAFPQADWLERLVDAAERHTTIKAFASRQLMDEDPTILDGLGDVMGGPCIPYRGGYRRRDPGDTFVWIAVGMGMIGLGITFYVPRRRLWVKVTPSRTYIAGIAERTAALASPRVSGEDGQHRISQSAVGNACIRSA